MPDSPSEPHNGVVSDFDGADASLHRYVVDWAVEDDSTTDRMAHRD